MISSLIAAFIVFAIISILERGKERGIDLWISFGFVLIPALLIFLLSLAIGFLGLSPWILILSMSLYVLIPVLILRNGFEFAWGRAFAYGGIVLVVALVVNIFYGYAIQAILS